MHACTVHCARCWRSCSRCGRASRPPQRCFAPDTSAATLLAVTGAATAGTYDVVVKSTVVTDSRGQAAASTLGDVYRYVVASGRGDAGAGPGGEGLAGDGGASDGGASDGAETRDGGGSASTGAGTDAAGASWLLIPGLEFFLLRRRRNRHA